jgi:hypothetical protein
MPETKAKIEICVPGKREQFTMFCRERGGIKVWKNINLSNPDAGNMYTPVRDSEGKDYPKPHWSVALDRIVTDISEFRFVKEMREVKRFHVAIRMGNQGLMLKLTDASTRRVREACVRMKEKYGESPCYHFDYDTQECVIEVPVWED